jgi:hypothetical protein
VEFFQRFANRRFALNKESRGAVDPFFSASSSRKTLADLRHSLLTGLRQKKLRAIFLSSGSGLTANRKNRSTPRDPIFAFDYSFLFSSTSRLL